MATNKVDRSFKTLINRETTDSDNKLYFNELGADTINVHADDIWVESVPYNDSTQAVSLGVAAVETLLVLTEDVTVPNSQSWRAGLKDWISPKFGADFTVHLFDNANNEIFPTDSIDWFFDYQTGILTFNNTITQSIPLKITGYRYIGDKGISSDSVIISTLADIILTIDGVSGSDLPTGTRPATIAGGDYSAEPFKTIQAAIETIPKIVLHNADISIIVVGDYQGFSLTGFNAGRGSINIVGIQGLVTPTTGPATGTATSGTSNSLALTGAAWTVDDFVGNFCKITSGTGSGQHFIIAENTADVLTFVADMSPAPDNTSVFEITRPLTRLTSAYEFNSGIYHHGCVGTFSVHDFHIDSLTFGVAQITTQSELALKRITQVGCYNGFICQDSFKAAYSQIGSLGSTDFGIGYLTVGTAGHLEYEKGWLAINAGTDGLLINNCGIFGCQGVFVKGCGNNGVHVVGSIGDLHHVVTNNNTYGAWIARSQTVIYDFEANNNTKHGMVPDCDGRINLQGVISGSGNGEWGIHAGVGIGGLVALTSLPIITGVLGDATVNGVAAIVWSTDFTALDDYAYFFNRDARIVRSAV